MSSVLTEMAAEVHPSHKWNDQTIVLPPRVAHPGPKHNAVDIHEVQSIAASLSGGAATQGADSDRLSFDGLTRTFTSEAMEDEARKMQKKQYKIFLASMFWCFFTLGLNDGSTGPLLPIYQDYYHLDFLIVSMIFISNCMGCITSAVLNVVISRRLAFSKILVLATALQITGYAILSGAPAFPVMCLAFFLNGMGMSFLNAQGNSILSMLHNPTAMGLAHASYGAGALVAPLISTQFAKLYLTSLDQANEKRWALYYTFLLAIALTDMASFIVVLKGMGYEDILNKIGVTSKEEEGNLALTRTRGRQGSVEGLPREQVDSEETGSGDEGGDIHAVQQRKKQESASFMTVMKQMHVHILAAFVFIYDGSEVTIGGWIVTFMINERGGGTSSGYISSGFFGGLAIGRIILLPVNKKLGERNAIFLYIFFGVLLEIVVWFVPSLIGDAIAVSFVGLLLGPFYPIVMSQTGRIIPRKVLSGSIGWIAGFGQSGSAVLPFLTGALANRYGILSLQPLIVAMLAAMAALWFSVPTVIKRTD